MEIAPLASSSYAFLLGNMPPLQLRGMDQYEMTQKANQAPALYLARLALKIEISHMRLHVSKLLA